VETITTLKHKETQVRKTAELYIKRGSHGRSKTKFILWGGIKSLILLTGSPASKIRPSDKKCKSEDVRIVTSSGLK
jgi:hypothetical protein